MWSLFRLLHYCPKPFIYPQHSAKDLLTGSCQERGERTLWGLSKGFYNDLHVCLLFLVGGRFELRAQDPGCRVASFWV